MIRQMVVTVRGRAHLDGRPAMALVLIGMHDVRLGVVIRSASRIGTRGNRENGGSAEHHEKPKTFVLVFETNDELAKTLQSFASEQRLPGALPANIDETLHVNHPHCDREHNARQHTAGQVLKRAG